MISSVSVTSQEDLRVHFNHSDRARPVDPGCRGARLGTHGQVIRAGGGGDNRRGPKRSDSNCLSNDTEKNTVTVAVTAAGPSAARRPLVRAVLSTLDLKQLSGAKTPGLWIGKHGEAGVEDEALRERPHPGAVEL
eukprot:763959-Hanusia_phi.AAC.1